MTNYRDWTGPESPWLREGYYVSYLKGDIRYYEHIIQRDLAHYVYNWHETIGAGDTSGPRVPDDLTMTLGYDPDTTLNRIWQLIFGLKGQVYIYIEMPTDIHRHGVPKRPKPDATMRAVSHFEEYMSPFFEPSFLTEHIMMKPGYDRINLEAYNPNSIDMTDVKLNIFIAKMTAERVGKEQYGDLSTPVVRDNPALTDRLKLKWTETLDKLFKRQIPSRPLTLDPVRAPAAE